MLSVRPLLALCAIATAMIGTAQSAAKPAARPPLPAGWKLDAIASGDLSGDGISDVAMVIRGEDPKLVIHNDRLGAAELDTNPRRLLVFAGGAAGWRQIAANDRFIPPAGSEDSSCLEDPLAEGGIAIARGVLSIKLHYWLSCGGWGVTSNTFKFQREGKRLRLIGFDHTEFMRNSGAGEEASVNFLTSRKSVTPFSIDDSVPKDLRWSRIASQRYYLDSIDLSVCPAIDNSTNLC